MKWALGFLAVSLLMGCAPVIGRPSAVTMQDLLVARATVGNRTLTFEIKNISQKPLGVQWGEDSDELCNPDPQWEIRKLDGIVVQPEPPLPPSGIFTCLDIGIAGFLSPGDQIELKRTLYLLPGTYSIKTWLRSPLESQYGRLEAPTITITIP